MNEANRESLRNQYMKMDAGGLKTLHKNNKGVLKAYLGNAERQKILLEVLESVMKERGIE